MRLTCFALKTITPQPSIKTIMETCGVSERTARRWVSGESDPDRGNYTLLKLTVKNRIMPKEWPESWEIKNGRLATGKSHSLSWQDIYYNGLFFSHYRSQHDKITELARVIDNHINDIKPLNLQELREMRANMEELLKENVASIENMFKLIRNLDQIKNIIQ